MIDRKIHQLGAFGLPEVEHVPYLLPDDEGSGVALCVRRKVFSPHGRYTTLYYHTDGVWRPHLTSEGGLTGVFLSFAAAEAVRDEERAKFIRSCAA